MKCTVIGVQQKIGQFTPKDQPGKVINFDNLVMHVVHKDMHVFGDAVETVSMKSADAGELIAAVGGEKNNLVGHVFDFDFNRFGKLTSFDLLK